MSEIQDTLDRLSDKMEQYIRGFDERLAALERKVDGLHEHWREDIIHHVEQTMGVL